MDEWRHIKVIENPADCGTRGMTIEVLKESKWLTGPAWLQKDEEKWPKPWCQENELEPEQVTSTVATERKLDQLFDWRRYSTFNRIRNFIAILDNISLTDEVLSTTMCLVEQTLNARTLTAVFDDPEDLKTLTPNHFLLGREKASAQFMPSNERYHDLRKSFKAAQAYADMIWKRWTRENLPQWNQRLKLSKEHLRNLKDGELLWLVNDSLRRCEYKLTNHWDLHWQRRSCMTSESQNGTWRAKPASREASASTLRWCFRDQKQGQRRWRHFKSATKAIR